METRILPLSSPCSLGFAVCGRLTSGPLRICGAITMKMISSTSTTSTSGVTLMADCILADSPSRISVFLLVGSPHALPPEWRHFEQTVDQLRRSAVHLDMKILDFAREVVECDDCRNSYEDAQGGRDQGLGDTARHYRHSTGACRRDVPECVDDSG